MHTCMIHLGSHNALLQVGGDLQALSVQLIGWAASSIVNKLTVTESVHLFTGTLMNVQDTAAPFEGYTALMYAAGCGHAEQVQMFLDLDEPKCDMELRASCG